ncbi:MAG: ABC transporter [Candidatus Dactylopiibacterium carminicum]|uniref:ABC transporter n=1 Tax=Candidatus Dactylopiibacterium carminicum TaxID=857335 RepID=A0A272ESM1_9RHOO|nr:VacJ family lipoprotein [Candidatus Dactylopiibacterium carminicum]KAF7599071.1 ABC transporter [Candidatus Dactylopiibacterium carminicum]PAS93078.1 MAG: ABC transporter [Candidatus Dactylopiibacterium carminicum]PAS96643.1 MAG: ABC transporter [Candidatus Dactylopiibacterium carminicum]PAS99082.1 MAG: ABC transporter [Candidatus Dactylopiibacterium carminicum]
MRGLRLLLALVCLGLSACASVPGERPDVDPWEGINRKVFAFNETLDKHALRPVAQGYEKVVPLPARTGVSNFFGNIEDLWTGVNNLLQGKPVDGGVDFGRFALNSTVGILGFFDVASEMELDKHEEDFGQTLGRWGVGSGPYLMLPFLGPSTVRDGFGKGADFLASPTQQIPGWQTRTGLTALGLINTRAQLLGADAALEQAALDKYAYLRDFYLQRRLSQIYDGRPPREDDFFDE